MWARLYKKTRGTLGIESFHGFLYIETVRSRHCLSWKHTRTAFLFPVIVVDLNTDGNYGIPVPDYADSISTKVVKIIQSYVGVVNKMVWRKEGI